MIVLMVRREVVEAAGFLDERYTFLRSLHMTTRCV